MKVLIQNYKNYSPVKKQLKEKQLAHFYDRNFPLSQWGEKYFINFLNDKNKRGVLCLILEKNHQIIGFILGRTVGRIPNRLNLTTLLVDKKSRGKGFSKILLDAFLQIIKQKKSTKKVYLHFRDSTNLEAFYKHYGFKNHRLAGFYSNGEKKHYMEISI